MYHAPNYIIKSGQDMGGEEEDEDEEEEEK